ncbi:uncharacterized protein LOC111699705 [Eurytemora carolleeae]|uniref:uncharacterized protein LOC111699705 n=1 Tax=Eurytemora carolleeae TaxID=1294199 RepID=UPI000C757953|nr:uncharacterized protein LOC111699705 [Eurytemora carolleeae]|eukprot:XP_023326200.1 uncharacterized protein LOC111699705 [Eurytemora affinis]
MYKLTEGQAGRYTCIARNTGGSAVTAYNVKVIDIKRFYQIMRLKIYIILSVGGCVLLLCTAVIIMYMYKKRRGDKNINKFHQADCDAQWTHLIPQTETRNSIQYSVNFSNHYKSKPQAFFRSEYLAVAMSDDDLQDCDQNEMMNPGVRTVPCRIQAEKTSTLPDVLDIDLVEPKVQRIGRKLEINSSPYKLNLKDISSNHTSSDPATDQDVKRNIIPDDKDDKILKELLPDIVQNEDSEKYVKVTNEEENQNIDGIVSTKIRYKRFDEDFLEPVLGCERFQIRLVDENYSTLKTRNITDLDLDKKRVTFSIPERYMKEFTPDREDIDGERILSLEEGKKEEKKKAKKKRNKINSSPESKLGDENKISAEEYKHLIQDLARMKEACDRLKQTNLRAELETLNQTISKLEKSGLSQNVGSLKERYQSVISKVATARLPSDQCGLSKISFLTEIDVMDEQFIDLTLRK